MRINDNARKILEARYLIKSEDGSPVETVEGMFNRVARAVAEPEKLYGGDPAAVAARFEEMMVSLDFLPNSPTLMNAGRELGQLSACFVLPVADSMEDIFEAIKQAALIHKSGGGTGFSFSRLRPRGAAVNSTGGVASGPISFMKVFNTATEAVKQGGTRRGANMGILRVDHPDILAFIDCKSDTSEITNFNISVGITEEFMLAAAEGRDYALVDPSTRSETGRLNAREVFGKIVDAAWSNGEPGIIFLDRLNRDNIVPGEGEIESTNPCGEQPLLPYESCNLGSINLVNMVSCGKLDRDKLRRTVSLAVRFLDNVIDANKYPLDKIMETTKKTRKIGLGVMGFADILLLLGIPYNSDEAVALAEGLMAEITALGVAASEELANERGAFPLFSQSTLKSCPPRRNATVTTIAPTGTLSIIAGASSGVEPVFAYAFTRNVLDGAGLVESNPVMREILIERGLYSDTLMEEIAKNGHVSDIASLPEDLRRLFVCAHDISPEWHIKMQAAFQKHTHNAVSKTVNFPNSATREDVREVFELAFRLDCKGVTIYRDGSRFAQVLSAGTKNDLPHDEQVCDSCEEREELQNGASCPFTVNAHEPAGIMPRPRPETTYGVTEKVKIGCGNLYVTVNYDDKGICEIFTNTGKAGGCPSQSEATARLASIALRSGMDVERIVEELRGIRCTSTIRQSGMRATSCPDGIARVIERIHNSRFADNVQKAPVEPKIPDYSKLAKKCPECGSALEHEGGCVLCRDCGYSKCG